MPIKPQPVENSVVATVYFTKPHSQTGYGFAVRFSVPPKIGDHIAVDQYSIRQIPNEDLHVCDWTVAQVKHEINLDFEIAKRNGEQSPLATLWVKVHPKHN